ncbi:hypothetical protein ACT7DL_07790 [Bacillus paranthracis]
MNQHKSSITSLFIVFVGSVMFLLFNRSNSRYFTND